MTLTMSQSVTKVGHTGFSENLGLNEQRWNVWIKTRGRILRFTAVNHGKIHDELFYWVSNGVNRQAIEQRRFPLE